MISRKTFLSSMLVGFAALAGCAGETEPAEQLTPEPRAQLIIPAGAELLVKPTDGMDLTTGKAGDTFAAVLASPVMADDAVLAPAGSPVAGEFTTEAKPAETGDPGEPTPVGIRLTSITMHDGSSYELTTAVVYPTAPEGHQKPDVREDATLRFVLTSPAPVGEVLAAR